MDVIGKMLWKRLKRPIFLGKLPGKKAEYKMTGPQWLEHISEVSGLDPLGVQAISINIYTYLLPGVSNVTSRLRYYTFLCWVLYNYSKTVKSKDIDDWRDYLRKSEFLFSLIAEIHHLKDVNSEPTSTVGAATARPVVKYLEEDTIDLHAYTDLSKSEGTYFKNRGGGLAQYYQGPMKVLKLLVSGGPLNFMLANDAEEPKEKRFGIRAAKIFESNKNLDLFHKCVLKGKVTVKELEKMGESLCACQIPMNKSEKELLLDLIFDRNDEFGEEGKRRKNSFLLMLYLIKDFGKEGADTDDFRDSYFYGYLPDERQIKRDKRFNSELDWWVIYQTNEYFAFALQSLLYVFERLLDGECRDIDEALKYMRKKLKNINFSKIAGLEKFNKIDFGENAKLNKFISNLEFSNKKENAWHAGDISEYCLTERSFDYIDNDKLEVVFGIAYIILGKIFLKSKGKKDFYNGMGNRISSWYRININHLKHVLENGVKENIGIWDFIEKVLKEFVVEWHTIVALRKMRYDKKSTLRFYINNDIYERSQRLAYDVPVFTSHRLSTSFRFLEDLGLIEYSDKKYVLTKYGKEFLKDY